MINVHYELPSGAALNKAARLVRASRNLEEFGEYVARRVALPSDLDVHVEECRGPARPFETDDERNILLCLETWQQAYETFSADRHTEPVAAEHQAGHVLTFAFAHELAHELIRSLELPVDGDVSVAADELALVLLLSFDEQVAATVVLYLPFREVGSTSLERQRGGHERFLDLFCLANLWGPAEYARVFPDEERTPAECARAQAAAVESWDLRLQP